MHEASNVISSENLTVAFHLSFIKETKKRMKTEGIRMIKQVNG